MNKLLYCFILALMFCGCATNARFVEYRNYDVGHSVDLSWVPKPSKISSYNQDQDKYLFEWNNGCKFVYYVDKKTKNVESWEYVSPPDKCSLGYNWLD